MRTAALFGYFIEGENTFVAIAEAIIKDKLSGESRSFGFAEMLNKEEAQIAVNLDFFIRNVLLPRILPQNCHFEWNSLQG